MKLQTTKKQIRNNSVKIYRLGYCELQGLLMTAEPFAYSAGVYGWQCDYYNLGGGVILATGYNTDRLGGEYVPAELVKRYKNSEYEGNFQQRKESLQNFFLDLKAGLKY